MTQEEIALLMGISRARVQQLEKKAIRKFEAALKKRLNGLDWRELIAK